MKQFQVFKKGQVLTVVSIRGNKVIIQDATILMSGAKITMFDCFSGRYETPTITPSIEELESKVHCYDCVAPNEDFIQRYIKLAILCQKKGLEKVKENLKKEPNSTRYKSHLKLYENELEIVDLRAQKKQAV